MRRAVLNKPPHGNRLRDAEDIWPPPEREGGDGQTRGGGRTDAGGTDRRGTEPRLCDGRVREEQCTCEVWGCHGDGAVRGQVGTVL